MLRPAYDRIHELAIEQFGAFTTTQARAVNVDHRTLAMMCRRGTLIREAHGVYRSRLVQLHRLTPYMIAALWPLEVQGVLSHESALELFEISDVNPAKIHITLPRAFRVRRAVPPQYVVHHADLIAEDVTEVEGVPVTTAARAIRDCHAMHLGPALLRQAIADGRRHGWLSADEATTLEREVLVRPELVGTQQAMP